MNTNDNETPQSIGKNVYEQSVIGFLKATNPSYNVLCGNDATLTLFLQIYPESYIANFPYIKRLFAILVSGRSIETIHGGSGLFAADYFFTPKSNPQYVEKFGDAKYTERKMLQYDVCRKSIELSRQNQIPLTITVNTDKVDTDLQHELKVNPKIKIQTVPLETARPYHPDNNNKPPPQPATSFVYRPYQKKDIDKLRSIIIDIDDTMETNESFKILCNFDPGWGKTHIPFLIIDQVQKLSEMTVILVPNISIATQIINEWKWHDTFATFENMTSINQHDLKRKLKDPTQLKNWKESRTVLIIYYHTFKDCFKNIDTHNWTLICDEIHSAMDIITQSCKLLIGMSAKKDPSFHNSFDRVLQSKLSELINVALVPKIILRIHREDDECIEDIDVNESPADESDHTIQQQPKGTHKQGKLKKEKTFTKQERKEKPTKEVAIDLEYFARKIINAVNDSRMGCGLLIAYDNKLPLKHMNEFREWCHQYQQETLNDIYISSFQPLHGPKRDEHNEIYCDKLKARLRREIAKRKESIQKQDGLHVDLTATEIYNFEMENGTRNSVINVDGSYWVACGYEIVRQDSISNEKGFQAMKIMLKNKRSGTLLSKHQCIQGINYPELQHVIIAGEMRDSHMIYQAALRPSRHAPDKPYAIVDFVGQRDIKSIFQMLFQYDPDRTLFQLECCVNVSIQVALKRTPEDWRRVSETQTVQAASWNESSREYIQNRQKQQEYAMQEKVIAHLFRNFRYQPPEDIHIRMDNGRRLPWKQIVDDYIARTKFDTLNTRFDIIGQLAQISWLPFNAPNGIVDLYLYRFGTAVQYDDAPAVFDIQYPEKMHDDLQNILQADIQPTQGMCSVKRGVQSKCVAVTLMLVLREIIKHLRGFQNLPLSASSETIDEWINAPRIRIDPSPRKHKANVRFKTDRPQHYDLCLQMFAPIMKHDQLLPFILDMNVCFNRTEENAIRTVIALHKWNRGYGCIIDYTSSGTKKTNPKSEKTEHKNIQIPHIDLSTNVYDVYEQFSTFDSKTQHHKELTHKLSKLFYVQILIFYILYPAHKERFTENPKSLLSHLKNIKFHSTFQVNTQKRKRD